MLTLGGSSGACCGLGCIRPYPWPKLWTFFRLCSLCMEGMQA
ncbi:unnamed protein product [Rhodiola kirilowii]